MNIYSIWFILIQSCYFQKCKNCLFEFQRPFSQNDEKSYFLELKKLQSSVIYHFEGDFV